MTLVPTRWWASFFMPSCLLLMGLAIGILWCLWAWKRGRTPRQARVPIALAAGSASLLYLASTPWVARWAASTLERDHPPVAVESLPQADAIVVLAGAIAARPRLDGSVHMFAGGAGDRFETGVAVPGAPAEGAWNRSRAIERGVPASAAIAAERAQYTSDEASNVAAELQKLGERGAKTIILCTSAWHLPRATRHYRALGLEVIPLPCDFMTRGPAEEWSPTLLIPRGHALWRVDTVAKEWLGMLAGR
jgi:uncharacterized SAM-binding protein YcdF (DUF218 family)